MKLWIATLIPQKRLPIVQESLHGSQVAPHVVGLFLILVEVDVEAIGHGEQE